MDGYRLIADAIVAKHFGCPDVTRWLTESGNAEVDSREAILLQVDGRHAGAIRAAETVAAARRFFHWDLEFPEVYFHYGEGLKQHVERRKDGDAGFDCIIGNPPYVRQETLKADKAFLKSAYEPVFDAANDLYVFFMYREIQSLQRHGLMSMIVANKWMRAGYGEKLRGFLRQSATLRSIVDFGHARIFPDADTFPCVPIFGRRTPAIKADEKAGDDETWLACTFPRSDYRAHDSIVDYVRTRSAPVRTRLLRDDVWSLEDPRVQALMEKIRNVGVPMKEYVGAPPYRGLVSGCNEAFYIDEAIRQQLIRDDKRSAEIIKPLLRGRDIDRWKPARFRAVHHLFPAESRSTNTRRSRSICKSFGRSWSRSQIPGMTGGTACGRGVRPANTSGMNYRPAPVTKLSK